MNIASIPAVPGARKRRKRVGRGIGSGHGKTSTRGQKGQRARTGSRKHPGFEGGQTPLMRKLPKRGFRRKSTTQPPIREILNVSRLNGFKDGERVTPERLSEAGLINDPQHEIKLLGEGTLSKRLAVVVHRASESAKAKLTKAGGTVELLEKQVVAPGSRLQAPGSGQEPRP